MKQNINRNNKNNKNNKKIKQKKMKKLNMYKKDEFRYLLNKKLNDLPESVRGSVSGGIYSIASRTGIEETKVYIMKKKEEGVIDEKLAKELINLLYRYSTYR